MKGNRIYHLVTKFNITKTLFIGYCIAFALIFYFAFFIFFGQKGLLEMAALNKKVTNREAKKQELSNKMQAKQNMIHGMSLESLDLDLLDEQSRQVLGYAGKNEMVIYQEKSLEKSAQKNPKK